MLPFGQEPGSFNALRRAFAQWGPCEHFYCDNGRDYRKVAKGAQAERIEKRLGGIDL